MKKEREYRGSQDYRREETYGMILKNGEKPEDEETTQKSSCLVLFDKLKRGQQDGENLPCHGC